MTLRLHASFMTLTSNAITRKARAFAALMSLYWVFYAIGAWYAHRFEVLLALPGGKPGFLFGATFVVWFVSFFAAVGFNLLKINRNRRYA
jgi:TRAP-type mannitol/chloroaromatic compound transport system permease large subunit